MSKDLNHVVLSGRLTDEPELRITESKNYAVSYNLACNRYPKKDEKGNYVSETDFIRCETFGPEAELICRHLKKGDELLVENGRLFTGSYEKDGRKVFYTRVYAQGIIFGKKAKKEKTSGSTERQELTETRTIPEISVDDLSFY